MARAPRGNRSLAGLGTGRLPALGTGHLGPRARAEHGPGRPGTRHGAPGTARARAGDVAGDRGTHRRGAPCKPTAALQFNTLRTLPEKLRLPPGSPAFRVAFRKKHVTYVS